MSEPFKQYPPRQYVPIMVDICKCGHAQYDHESDFDSLRSWLLWKGVGDGLCKICQCPYFKKSGKQITKAEYNKLHESNDNSQKESTKE